MSFLNQSYTCFHAIQQLQIKLEQAGFTNLHEENQWQVELGGKYYVIRNGSSIIAFQIPKEMNQPTCSIVASHSDSPCYKLKPNMTLQDMRNHYTRLNTEPYGGMLHYTWFDRPLGIAGRVFVEEGDTISEQLVQLDQTLVIPSVAIHMNRSNEFSPNPQVDLLPIFSESDTSFEKKLSEYVDGKIILSHDLFLYNKEEACLGGANQEYILSGRLDDLECAYLSVDALVNATPSGIAIAAIFNNEEVGSRSSNGADSSFLMDVLTRIAQSLSLDFYSLMSQSFMVSADNAHAVHPNHPEKSDTSNAVYMNKGIVIKHQAGLSYTTDGYSEAVFKKICQMSQVPYQDYTNRSDMRGGSTLGAISQSHFSIPSVDVGLAQLAMHSCYETAGTQDVIYMKQVFQQFYETSIQKEKNKVILKSSRK